MSAEIHSDLQMGVLRLVGDMALILLQQQY